MMYWLSLGIRYIYDETGKSYLASYLLLLLLVADIFILSLHKNKHIRDP
jgi:hypothetical protein